MKLVIILLAFVFLVVSCGKVPDSKVIPSFTTVSAREVQSFLTNQQYIGWNEPVLTDEDYVIPTVEWVNGELTKRFNQFTFDYNVRWYVEGRNECDKFSLYARAIANTLNRHNPNAGAAGIAFGEVFMLHGINSHAMNFAIVAEKDKKLKLVFYEPQVSHTVSIYTNDLVILRWRM